MEAERKAMTIANLGYFLTLQETLWWFGKEKPISNQGLMHVPITYSCRQWQKYCKQLVLEMVCSLDYKGEELVFHFDHNLQSRYHLTTTLPLFEWFIPLSGSIHQHVSTQWIFCYSSTASTPVLYLLSGTTVRSINNCSYLSPCHKTRRKSNHVYCRPMVIGMYTQHVTYTYAHIRS